MTSYCYDCELTDAASSAILEVLADYLRETWDLQVEAVTRVVEIADVTDGRYGRPCTRVRIDYVTPDGVVDYHPLSSVSIASLVRGQVDVPRHELTWSIP